ncbi:polysaccharide pyruvyl transferase family protein [Pontiellaceae bacterium B12219]|nr:polysaccharide pyruvyl transferase family protein [Pontiellaceae bacterium B12219]
MNKIAVWGPNRWCNFGDDLQSVVFALHLKAEGYDPVVFQLDRGIASEHDLEVADSVDELLKDVKLCIIAGGALLTPLHLAKQLLKSDFRQYERDFGDLHRGAKKYGTRFCAISMGGDGKIRNTWFWYSLKRNLFFRSKYFVDGTVRLAGDVVQMKQFGKNFIHIPDCLFSLNKFIQVAPSSQKKADEPIRIGFNFRERQIPSQFIKDIHDYAATQSDMEFYFATTHMDKVIEKYGITYEYLPNEDTHNVKFMHYETPNQLIQFVANMDVFVASKLHLGLVGLLVGTPFISYRGMGKARTFLKSIGGDDAILDDEISFSDLISENGLLRKSKAELMEQYDMNLLQKMVDDSWGQFEFCSNIAKEYA